MSLIPTPGAIPTESEATMLTNLPPAGNSYLFFDTDQSNNLYSIDSSGNINFVALAGSIECCACCVSKMWLEGLTEALNNGAITGDQFNTAISQGISISQSNDGRGNCSMNVSKKNPILTAIAIVPRSTSIVVNSNIQLAISATPIGANSNVIWVPSDPTKITVNPAGLAHGVAIGSSVVTAYSVENAAIMDSITITVTG